MVSGGAGSRDSASPCSNDDKDDDDELFMDADAGDADSPATMVPPSTASARPARAALYWAMRRSSAASAIRAGR